MKELLFEWEHDGVQKARGGEQHEVCQHVSMRYVMFKSNRCLHPARAGVNEHRSQDVLPHHGPSRRLADQEGRGLRSKQAGF